VSYDVGQILYVVSSRKMEVKPVIVSEEVVRKTLSGRETTYLVKSRLAEDAYNLSKLNGAIFESLEEVREYLINNVTAAVDKICKNAATASEPLSGKTSEAESLPKKQKINVPTNSQIKNFILDDGTKVRVDLQDI